MDVLDALEEIRDWNARNASGMLEFFVNVMYARCVGVWFECIWYASNDFIMC